MEPNVELERQKQMLSHKKTQLALKKESAKLNRELIYIDLPWYHKTIFVFLMVIAINSMAIVTCRIVMEAGYTLGFSSNAVGFGFVEGLLLWSCVSFLLNSSTKSIWGNWLKIAYICIYLIGKTGTLLLLVAQIPTARSYIGGLVVGFVVAATLIQIVRKV